MHAIGTVVPVGAGSRGGTARGARRPGASAADVVRAVLQRLTRSGRGDQAAPRAPLTAGARVATPRRELPPPWA